MNKAVFLDRDGVLNELVQRGAAMTAPWCLDELRIFDESKKSIEILKQMNYKTFVVTNQPDVYDNKMSHEQLIEINMRIKKELDVDLILCALKRNSAYYKPNNMMLEFLIDTYDLDCTQCYMIGDRWKDIVCGYITGVTTIFIGDDYECPEEYESIEPDYITKNILTACKIIKDNT